MTVREHRVFPARLAMLAETAAFVESFSGRHGIASADALRLTLIVEELFTNTVVHGFGGDRDEPIRVDLVKDDGEVTLLYEDTAPAFDPLAMLERASPEVDAAVEQRPVGGLGVFIVEQLVERARYVYEDDRNRLCLTVWFVP